MLNTLEVGTVAAEFAADVRRDLQLEPKQLQSKYLYDALGSSLFDAICRLPWYHITRAESRLLAKHGGAAVSPLDEGGTIVELGCGNGEKLMLLAEALESRGGSARVHLVDVSAQALEETERRLASVQGVSVALHRTTYEDGLRRAAAARESAGPMLVLFLGSNLGNFDTPVAQRFLADIRALLVPGDRLLLGADLLKPRADLLLAYDDPLGVTAAFNKNLLVRINRELGGTFELAAFEHRAVWNAPQQRIEMHLVSRKDQTVTIEASRLDVPFSPDEYIWTESSYSYDAGQILAMGRDAGFAATSQWIERDARFALTLFTAV